MKRTERGFTLVEVVVAVLLMGILFMGLATMPRNILSMRAAYSAKAAASHLAEMYLEIRRDTDFDMMAAQILDVTLDSNPDITYTVEVSVARTSLDPVEVNKIIDGDTGSEAAPQPIEDMLVVVGPSEPVDCQLVTVLVRWQANGIDRSLQRQAIIHRYEE